MAYIVKLLYRGHEFRVPAHGVEPRVEQLAVAGLVLRGQPPELDAEGLVLVEEADVVIGPEL